MNREQIKRFLELVDSGAQLKAYQRELGLDYHAYKYHLTRLHYYRSLFIEEEEPTPSEVLSALEEVVEEERVEEVFESDESLEEDVSEDEAPAPEEPAPEEPAPKRTLRGRKSKDEE